MHAACQAEARLQQPSQNGVTVRRYVDFAVRTGRRGRRRIFQFHCTPRLWACEDKNPPGLQASISRNADHAALGAGVRFRGPTDLSAATRCSTRHDCAADIVVGTLGVPLQTQIWVSNKVRLRHAERAYHFLGLTADGGQSPAYFFFLTGF
jgi:hypothetical protein